MSTEQPWREQVEELMQGLNEDDLGYFVERLRHIRSGEESVNRKERTTRKDSHIESTARVGSSPGLYRTIVADPPWTPRGSERSNAKLYARVGYKGYPQRFYSTLSVVEIAALKIPAPTVGHLWLWALPAHLDWAWEVSRAWGYEPITCITWCKPSLGVGRFQSNTEHVVLARRGVLPFGMTRGTWFKWPRGRHSEKPDAFYDLVEQVSPGPYLELFARRARFGWDYWGDQSLGTAVLDTGAEGPLVLERTE